MLDQLDRADAYRRIAVEMEQMAERLSAAQRVRCLEVARVWRELAAQIEDELARQRT